MFTYRYADFFFQTAGGGRTQRASAAVFLSPYGMSTDSSPPIISPMFIGRNWIGSSQQRGVRRSPNSPVQAPMPQHGSTSSMSAPPDFNDGLCSICSPPFRGAGTKSPLSKIEDDSNESYGMVALRANAWLSPAICSMYGFHSIFLDLIQDINYEFNS